LAPNRSQAVTARKTQTPAGALEMTRVTRNSEARIQNSGARFARTIQIANRSLWSRLVTVRYCKSNQKVRTPDSLDTPDKSDILSTKGA